MNRIDEQRIPWPPPQHADTCTCWRCKDDAFADLPEESEK